MWKQIIVAGLLVQVVVATSPPLFKDAYTSPIKPPIFRFRRALQLKALYVTQGGGIVGSHRTPSVEIAATVSVSDAALQKAATIVSLMVRYMPNEVFQGLAHSHGVGLFTQQEGVTVYPENYNLADTPACYGRCDGSCARTCTPDGRKWSQIAALTNSRSVVIDLNLLCDPRDGYARMENVLVHEFGHLVHKYMPSYWQNQISTAFANAQAYRLWTPGTYAMSNSAEYWAEATSAFFMTIYRTDVTGGLNMCGTYTHCSSESAARSYLQHHDPLLYAVLSYAYTNHRPYLPSGLKPCM